MNQQSDIKKFWKFFSDYQNTFFDDTNEVNQKTWEELKLNLKEFALNNTN